MVKVSMNKVKSIIQPNQTLQKMFKKQKVDMIQRMLSTEKSQAFPLISAVRK